MSDVTTDDFVDPRTLEFSSHSERQSAMYQLADRNDKKGKMGGDCNRTQCQKHGASSWNRGSHAWYCSDCANELNHYNPNAMSDGKPMVDAKPDGHYDYDPNGVYEEELSPEEQAKVDGEAEISKLRQMAKDFHSKMGLGEPTNRTPLERHGRKIGRNEPCSCRSGKKYKKCCGA